MAVAEVTGSDEQGDRPNSHSGSHRDWRLSESMTAARTRFGAGGKVAGSILNYTTEFVSIRLTLLEALAPGLLSL